MKTSALPPSCPPRLLSKPAAAEYLAISLSKFEDLVRAGDMPGPKRIGSRVAWDRHALDRAVDAMSDNDDENPFD
jgi:excisionase family DNA binding protein